jgi:hypothetical protein
LFLVVKALWFRDLASLPKKVPQIDVYCVSKWIQEEIEGLFHNSTFELWVGLEC